MKHISTALFLSTVAGLSLGIAHTAHAQTAARFSTVEFKDTTLNDALEMIFQAANNPAHTIDPSASQVPIGSITLQNIQWDSALRTLANQNNFKVSRGADGSYLVEPREPVLQNGGEGGGFMAPGGSGFNPRSGFGSPGGAPFNPFSGGGRPSTNNAANFELVPSVSTQANAQTTPRFGTGGGGGTTDTSNMIYQIIPVRHIYAGGIAQLFNNSSVIGTDIFVSPASNNSNNNGGGGFGGGNNNGGGGFGGGGGNSFGGGGFGGGGNSFGGGGGGFGGGGNSFGGGGFGGGGNSFGGGGNSFGGGGGGFGF